MEQAASKSAKSVSAIRRKLHGWELLHLREHAAALEQRLEELEAENERLRSELTYAEDLADSWRDDVMRMMEDGMEVGLTKDGHVVALTPQAYAQQVADLAPEAAAEPQRREMNFMPNRPDLMGELRPEFRIEHGAWRADHPSGEPTIDAPETLASGSTTARFSEDTNTILVLGHVSRGGWQPKLPGTHGGQP